MSPVSCSACVPRIATAIASSHMRMRPQLPMFTTSETAPMVQKLVRLATAPKTKASANPPSATIEPSCEAVAAKGPPQEPSILTLVARRIGHARLGEALATETARVAAAAGAARRVGVVAGHREREIHAELGATAHDVGLAHAHDRRLDRDSLSLDRALGAEIGHLGEGGEELGSAVRIPRVVDRVHADEDRLRAGDLRVGECEREEDRVARGEIGD